MGDRVLVRSQFDPQVEQSVSVVVAEALALVVDEYDRYPPLAEQVDTDSLDALFSAEFEPTPTEDLQLTFPYEDWTVTVIGEGTVVVRSQSNRGIPSR